MYDPATDPKMIAMLAEARVTRQLLHTPYHDLWFTPEELEQAWRGGRFLWGPVNWQLRSMDDYVTQASHAVRRAQQELDARVQRMRGYR